jgi:hypothetical protein
MSSITWLDFNDADRQRALDVLDLFREKGTVDELGIGTVRDSLADILFPGTSTIMTRIRYYFFIPWIYQKLERKKVASAEIGQLGRRDEIKLIDALRTGPDTAGLIGLEAGKDLKRVPSTTYWQGLHVLGFRRFPGSRDAYHRSLDRFHRDGGDVIRGDDGQVVVGGRRFNWDPAMPQSPTGFPTGATFALTPQEADYFKERVLGAAPASFFAQLLIRLDEFEDGDLPWDEPAAKELVGQAAEDLRHARNFSDAMHGAALTYNLMLAEKQKAAERRAEYGSRIDDWAANVQLRRSALASWDRAAFWATVEQAGRPIRPLTRAFIDAWLDAVIDGDPNAVVRDASMRDRIRKRERQLKGPLARLENDRALERWGGASSAEALDFRWNRPTRSFLRDLKAALVTA